MENVSVNYGSIVALRDVNIEVNEGEIVSLIGSNGGGKSTLMKSIMGLVKVQTGNIFYRDKNITNIDTRDIVKNKIILVPEGRQIFPKFSVYDNLLLGAYLSDKKDIEKNLKTVQDLFPILKERMHQAGGTLSGGEQQMLAVGRAMMANPKILLLDEPSLGLAPLIIEDIFRLIVEIKSMGATILLVEQNAKMALKIADRGYVLETGKVVSGGKASDLMNSPEVVNAYLGG